MKHRKVKVMTESQVKFTSILRKYPSHRDHWVHACWLWLAGRRLDDGAEGLWRIYDKLYDVSVFVEKHPGGKEWLELTKGTDITEVFESTHLNSKPREVLENFYIRDAQQPRNYLLTFEENGFYQTLKRRVVAKIPKIDKNITQKSKIYFDWTLFLTFAAASSIMWMNHKYQVLMIFLTGLLIEWVNVIGHNFVHTRNNWRMKMTFLSLFSWRDWRVFHVMSHHPYPNSNADLEIEAFNPFLNSCRQKKSLYFKVFSYMMIPYIYLIVSIANIRSRLIGIVYSETKVMFWDELIQFSIPFTIFITNPYEYSLEILFHSIKLWFYVILVTGTVHSIISLSAGHHGTTITHEGDQIKSLDFGIYQMAATIDRIEFNSNLFLALTHFGHHTMHHLFPTLDHAILPYLYDEFVQTCNEFEEEIRKFSIWEGVKEQLKQMSRTKVIRIE